MQFVKDKKDLLLVNCALCPVILLGSQESIQVEQM